MMTEQGRQDVPKVVATIMWTVPGFAIRTGGIYLRWKRDLRRSSKILRAELVRGGLPEEYAKKLVEGYETSLSLRKLLRNIGGGRLGFIV